MKRNKPDFFIIAFFAVASAILMSVGCGQKNSSSSAGAGSSPSNVPSDSGSLLVSQNNLASAREFVSHIAVECGSECHPSVAMMASVHAKGAQFCTAFLIRPNQVLTNSHCVPESMKAPLANCSKDIQFVFGDKRRVDCARIIADSRDGLHKQPIQDYAIIELAETLDDRTPFPISEEGVEDETHLKVIHIDPAPERSTPGSAFIGIMQSKNCESMIDHVFNPIYQSPFSLEVSLKGCLLRAGNSGSPLVDSNGRVRAIANRIFFPTGSVGSARKDDEPAYRTHQQAVAATNLACIEELFPKSKNRAECQVNAADFFPKAEKSNPHENETDDHKKTLQQLPDEVGDQLVEIVEKLQVDRKTRTELRSASDLFQFESLQISEDGHFGYTAAVRCYLASAEPRLRDRSSGGSIDVDYPVLQVSRDSADDFGRLYTSVQIKYARRTLQVSPSNSTSGGEIQIGDYAVKRCPEQKKK